MTEKIRLIYYNLRGRAELIRYVLLAANIEFEEERIERPQWPSVKKNYNLPAGQIPVIILTDGTILNESLAIARFFSNLHNLGGSSPTDKYKCDRAVYTLEDLFKNFALIYHEKDENKKCSLKHDLEETILPKFLKTLTSYLKETKGPFFLEGSPSFADLHLLNVLDNIDIWKYKEYAEIQECCAKVLEHFPQIKKYRDQYPKFPI